MTPSTNPTEQHVDKQQQRSIISSFLREEVDELMASGLMPRPSDLQQVHKDVMPVMAVYLPCPTTPTHRVQWPLPSPQETNASGTSSSNSAQPQQQLSEPCYGTLISKHSRQGAFVLFANTTPHTVRLMWINYKGEEVAYDTLLPGHSCIQQTFATHPWVAREVSTATRLPINMQEGFCPRAVKVQPRRRAPAAAPAPAPAGPPAGPQDAAAAAGAPAQGPQLQQPQLLQQQWFTFQGPNGEHRVPILSLQRAEIAQLPALLWTPAAHPHFPPGFKAAVKTFLLCHSQLQQSVVVATEHTHCAAATSHLGCIPSALLPVIVRMAAPFTPQHMELPLALRPDVLPTCLAEAPDAPLPPFAEDLLEEDSEEEEEDWVAAAGELPGAGAAAGGAGAAVGGAGAAAAGGGGAAVAVGGDVGGPAGDGYVPLADEPGMDEEGGDGEEWEEAEGNAMEQ